MTRTTQHPKPPFPAQHLDRPGLESELRPEPQYLAPGYRGQTTYRVRLDRTELERLAAAHGRTIARTFDVEGEIQSFLLVR